ncbi:hypothetical protein AC579_406 [Pseudocercospora musae]|uniref:Uncharacterized protein n=1 Tax=Pseudocercospora musae TaxID=113226 RepID=A0A139GY74_9PEZI|nr:hypothetical protein AC579_406 [Pseudocercospora musae]
MRFSTLATLFALMTGAFASYWNCVTDPENDGVCVLGSNEQRLYCTYSHPCKTQGNGCTPIDTNNDGKNDAANCS